MPLEFYFKTSDQPHVKLDYHLLEQGERSGLYADHSTGEKQLIGMRCDEDDRGYVEVYPTEGVLDTDELKEVAEEDLPAPFAVIEITPGKEYPINIKNSSPGTELVARYKPVGEIGLGDSIVVIPTSLLNPN